MAKILVVDDHEQQRYLARVLFETHGHEVLEAENGSEALDIARRAAPDLIVTDILMPDMDGFTLCRAWQRDETLREVPLVFYTATYTDIRDEDLALSLGAARFIRKPTEPRDVARIVEEVLAERRVPPSSPPPDDAVYLRNYSAALVRKLEDKVGQLERTQASVDQAATPIVWVSSEGRVPYANDAAREAFGPGDLEIWDVDTELDADSWRAQLWDKVPKAGRYTYASSCTRAGGDSFPAEITASLWERFGQAQLLLFITDISERRALEEKLVQSQRMQAMALVSSGVAHDFNNFIMVINSALSLARRDLSAGKDPAKALGEIAEGASRAAKLTQQLLAFGRAQPLDPARLEVNAVVADLERLLVHALGSAHRLELALGESAGHIVADRSQFENVLMNLAINARDAMPDGGVVRIETARKGNWVHVIVTDNGSGMTPDTCKHLFEPFFTTKPPGAGTGLGMSSVYGIVQQTGGQIEVESAVGNGTRVDIALPADDGA